MAIRRGRLVLTVAAAASLTTGCASTDRTHANVPGIARHLPASESIIVYLNPDTVTAKDEVARFASKNGHKVVYDLTTMKAVVIGNVASDSVDRWIARYTALQGVAAVHRNQTVHLDAIGSADPRHPRR